jgi:N-acetylmuramoyl-L-alanine amidase
VAAVVRKPSFISKDHAIVNQFSRPGIVRERTVAIDLHWNNNPGMSEYQLSRYLKSLSDQDPTDSEGDRYAGANYVVGPDSVLEIVPPDEVTYTAGADGIKSFYTPMAKDIFGSEYTRYWPDSKLSPNYLTCSLELVHPDGTGKFLPEAVNNAAMVVAWLVGRYDEPAILRHYDITEKLCPKYWVEHHDKWLAFLAQVSAIRQIVEGA